MAYQEKPLGNGFIREPLQQALETGLDDGTMQTADVIRLKKKSDLEIAANALLKFNRQRIVTPDPISVQRFIQILPGEWSLTDRPLLVEAPKALTVILPEEVASEIGEAPYLDKYKKIGGQLAVDETRRLEIGTSGPNLRDLRAAFEVSRFVAATLRPSAAEIPAPPATKQMRWAEKFLSKAGAKYFADLSDDARVAFAKRLADIYGNFKIGGNGNAARIKQNRKDELIAFLGGSSSEEIAKQRGGNKYHIKRMINRTTEKIRQEIGQEGIDACLYDAGEK